MVVLCLQLTKASDGQTYPVKFEGLINGAYIAAAICAFACHHVPADPCWHARPPGAREGIPQLQFPQEVEPRSFAGTVLDSATRRPLSGVSVVFPILRMGTMTDSSGAFRIRNLPLGRHALRVRTIGYYQISDSVTVSGSTGTAALYSLAIDPRGVCEVTVAFHSNRARHLTNVAADKHFSDAASPQWW
jgi:hypothetical protein